MAHSVVLQSTDPVALVFEMLQTMQREEGSWTADGREFNQLRASVNATRAAAGKETLPLDPDFVWLRTDMIDPDCLSILDVHHG